MRRIMALFAVIGMLGIAVTSASWRADAQGDDSDLRTQVANLQTRVAALETRVAGSDATPIVAGETHTITGDITLINENGRAEIGYLTRSIPNEPCEGASDSGFDDLRARAPVTVKNEAGVTIATAPLQEGVLDNDLNCVFPFEVVDVPVAAFYTIEVSHRGGLSYSYADMEALGWVLHLSLG